MIDGSPLFLEYIRDKLTSEQLNVDTATGRRDAYTKMITGLPDLVLINVEDDVSDYNEFFENKANDPNCRKIPIIICGPKIERARATGLLQFGVVKYFSKPVKFDIFFEAVSKVLNHLVSVDPTTCICEVHTNNNIIFIEMSQGLNREKIFLLKYKIADILDANQIKNPKVLIMLTNMNLTYVDGINIELLFDTVLADSRIKASEVYILSSNHFVKNLIEGHSEYSSLRAIDNLVEFSSNLIDSGPADLQDAIADKILFSSTEDSESSVDTRFLKDIKDSSKDDSVISVAIIDDDAAIRNQLNEAFSKLTVSTSLFQDGQSFLDALDKENFDIAILDIFMPGLSGFDVLNQLKARGSTIPIIIYSQSTQREMVVQSLTLGAKSYVVKPQKPEVIIQKAMSLLNRN